MTQLEFQAEQAGSSQCERILSRLRASVNEWVPMPALAQAASRNGNGVGLAVHSRVTDLRKRGHCIAHKNEKRDGQIHSYYMLVVGAEATERVVSELIAPVE